MKRLATCGIILLLAAASGAIGQVIYNSASTAAEGYANGVSNVIAAQGQRNLSNSQAAINLTEARSNQIDNQVKSVNAFWEKRDIYNERQQANLAEISARRDRYLSKNALQPLTSQDFDRTTGKVFWLKVLDQPKYDQYRKTIDELMKKRAYAGALTGDEYMEYTQASKAWRAQITTQKEYPPQIQSQMLRFILGVDREVNDNLG